VRLPMSSMASIACWFLKPGVLEASGLGYRRLRAAERSVYVSICEFVAFLSLLLLLLLRGVVRAESAGEHEGQGATQDKRDSDGSVADRPASDDSEVSQ